MMYYHQLGRSTYQDSLKVLESDIQHANDLAATIPKAKGGTRLQMKLVYNHLAPLLMFFLQWIDCSCACFLPGYFNLFHVIIYKVYADGRPKISTHGRKASIKEFYGLSGQSVINKISCKKFSKNENICVIDDLRSTAVILPSLRQLHHNLGKVEGSGTNSSGDSVFPRSTSKKRLDERDDECGICLELCTKVVVSNCCHAMCINCYRDWSMRSESCPFCRGSLKRVKSRDLWVLMSKDEVIDREAASMEELRQFLLYVRNLPKDSPDVMFLMYYEYLI